MGVLPLDPVGFVGRMLTISLVVPLLTIGLILGTVVRAIRRSVPVREETCDRGAQARLARGEIDPIEYAVRMRALRRGGDA